MSFWGKSNVFFGDILIRIVSFWVFVECFLFSFGFQSVTGFEQIILVLSFGCGSKLVGGDSKTQNYQNDASYLRVQFLV